MKSRLSARLCDQANLYGVGTLSDTELLCLSTGIERSQVQTILDQHPIHELMNRIDALGLDSRQRIQLEALFQILQRIGRAQYQGGISIRTPQDVAALFMAEIGQQSIEVAMIALLNVRNKLIRVESMATGTVSSAFISPREIARVALRHNAVNLILVHNHPSGDSSPSADDITATKGLINALELLNIHLLDHLVVSGNSFTSLKQAGLI